MDVEKLSLFLTEYVKRGCYFPFSVIEAALGSELSYLIEDEVENFKQEIVKATRRSMERLLLGFKRDWSELSFQERATAQLTWEPKGDHGDLRHLHQYLAHLHLDPRAHEDGRKALFRMIDVRTKEEEDPQPLFRFNEYERKPFCGEADHASDEGGEVAIFGDCSGVADVVTSRDAEHEFNPCFACLVSGLPGAVLISGARVLARRLLEKTPAARRPAARDGEPTPLVGYRARELDRVPDDTHTFGTLLCWGDVEGFFETFCREMRAPDMEATHPPCSVCMVSKYWSEAEGRVLLAIFWRGGSDDGTSGTGAKLGLLSWAAEQNAAGRKVSSIKFWFKQPDGQEELQPIYPATQRAVGDESGDSSAVKSPASGVWDSGAERLWDIARAKSDAGGYHFAYVAVFDCSVAARRS